MVKRGVQNMFKKTIKIFAFISILSLIFIVYKNIAYSENATYGNILIDNASYNENKGSVKVIVKDINNEKEINCIYAPTWSDKNGQDDIVWHKMQKTKDNNGKIYYQYEIKMSEHKYDAGRYNIHIYFVDRHEKFIFQKALIFNFAAKYDKPTVGNINTSQLFIPAQISKISIPGGLKGVKAAVWSTSKGQDDLLWYNMNKSELAYYYNIPLKNIKSYGNINIHFYALMKNNNCNFLSALNINYDKPSINSVNLLEETYDSKVGSISFKISNIKNSYLIKNIYFPTWSEQDGQDDIVWHKAQKHIVNNEVYYDGKIEISKHKYDVGKYNIHFYFEDNFGRRVFIKAKQFDFKISYSQCVLEKSKDKEKTFKSKISNLETPGKEKNVEVAVWSSTNGQDDLRWYTMNKSSNTYVYNIPSNNLKHTGLINVHFYLVSKTNRRFFLCAKTYKLSNPTCKIVLDSKDGTSGDFKCSAKELNAVSGINSVRVAIWSNDNGQDDIVWYNMTRINNKEYSTSTNVNKHKHGFGKYNVHVYATMGNGIEDIAGAFTFKISPSNYVYVSSYNSNKSACVVTVLNANFYGVKPSKVQFPTWSSANGQDDIVWYNATNYSDNNFQALINSTNHRNSGEYITHIYYNGNGVKEIRYNLTIPDPTLVMATNMVNRFGRDLYQAYRWSASFRYQTVNPSTCLSNGNAWCAQYGFTNGCGNCYIKAATFTYMARALGYQANTIYGVLPNTGGRNYPHAWCEIVVNGTTYLVDPDFEYEAHRNGYLIHYGQSGTWVYRKQGILP